MNVKIFRVFLLGITFALALSADRVSALHVPVPDEEQFSLVSQYSSSSGYLRIVDRGVFLVTERTTIKTISGEAPPTLRSGLSVYVAESVLPEGSEGGSREVLLLWIDH